MSRPVPTLATVAATLDAALRAPLGSWPSLAAEREARALVAHLRVEALRVVADARANPGAGDSLATASAELGVARSTLAKWLATGGWLA